MSKKKWPALRLKQDWIITIPAGTIIHSGPSKREWGETSFSFIEEVHKDGCAYVDFGVTDARLRPDLFEETEE
jgi:hypothetical protein